VELPANPPPRAVVFDIGEVVIDETRVWAVWAELLGVSPLTLAAVMGAAIVQGLDHELALSEVAPNVDWRELAAAHEDRYGGFRPEDVYPDVRPCLAELTETGLRTVLAGNQPMRRHEQLLALDLGAGEVATSAQIGAGKPDPGFFEAIVEIAGVPGAEVLYVGDRVDNDVLPATAAGLSTCWLRRGPWGRLQDLPEDVAADLVLDGLGELATLLRAWPDEDDG
jgi:HAD superfamily hydrolase (TIGR01549 family)